MGRLPRLFITRNTDENINTNYPPAIPAKPENSQSKPTTNGNHQLKIWSI